MLLVTIPACVLSVQIRSYSTLYFPYSVRMRENADKNNSEYEHFLHSVSKHYYYYYIIIIILLLIFGYELRTNK